jgi:methylthioribose-1-phosphate isomerase
MIVNGNHFRTIWPDQYCQYVEIINQTKLPFAFEVVRISNLSEMVQAIKSMQVRGAPLIGVAAAYGLALALIKNANNQSLELAIDMLVNSRPTAVNLSWALQRMKSLLLPLPESQRLEAAWKEAALIADEDVQQNQAIGRHGKALIQQNYNHNRVNILTHCNAGWLATVDYGTALSPIYAAHDAGIPVHVWVDETRPRNQGASLTAWELAQHGVPHTVITDNAGGHLMQKGQVDIVIVGADRVTASGDVCNKVGTYLKALAAHDNNIPFYAAVPSPTIDWKIEDGLNSIEIEERDADEVAYIQGLAEDGNLYNVRVIPTESFAINPAFDVTPSRLVTGIITEKGVYQPNQLTNQAI